MMRRYHRWISFPLILFLIMVTVTGLYLQVVETAGAAGGPSGASPRRSLPAREALLADIGRALDAAEQARPGFPAQKLEIGYGEKGAELKIATSQRIGPSVTVDLASGNAVYTERPPRNLRTVFVLLHSGKFFGIPGLVIILLAGLILLALSVTGLVLYLQMYLRRRVIGRPEPFWR